VDAVGRPTVPFPMRCGGQVRRSSRRRGTIGAEQFVAVGRRSRMARLRCRFKDRIADELLRRRRRLMRRVRHEDRLEEHWDAVRVSVGLEAVHRPETPLRPSSCSNVSRSTTRSRPGVLAVRYTNRIARVPAGRQGRDRSDPYPAPTTLRGPCERSAYRRKLVIDSTPRLAASRCFLAANRLGKLRMPDTTYPAITQEVAASTPIAPRAGQPAPRHKASVAFNCASTRGHSIAIYASETRPFRRRQLALTGARRCVIWIARRTWSDRERLRWTSQPGHYARPGLHARARRHTPQPRCAPSPPTRSGTTTPAAP
jgi:hypothetical protein